MRNLTRFFLQRTGSYFLNKSRKIIFHIGVSDFGEGNAAELLQQSDDGKMLLLIDFVSSTRYRLNYLPALFFIAIFTSNMMCSEVK